MKKILLVICFALLISGFSNVFAQKKTQKSADSKVVKAGIINGKAISLPKPRYPAAARAIKVVGTVSVQVLIDKKGNVETARVVNGHPLLRRTSVNAALKAKFRPVSYTGTPVKLRGTIVYRFSGDSNGLTNNPNPAPLFRHNIIVSDAISLPIPRYPVAAKATCASGIVKVSVDINKTGSVTAAKAIGGHPLLRRAAVRAAKLSKFTPSQKPNTNGILTYYFSSSTLKNCLKK